MHLHHQVPDAALVQLLAEGAYSRHMAHHLPAIFPGVHALQLETRTITGTAAVADVDSAAAATVASASSGGGGHASAAAAAAMVAVMNAVKPASASVTALVAADGERLHFERPFRAEGAAETWLARVVGDAACHYQEV
jgi:hypothetical protein